MTCVGAGRSPVDRPVPPRPARRRRDGRSRRVGVLLALPTVAAGCVGGGAADAVVHRDDVLACLAEAVPGVYVSTHPDDLDEVSRAAGEGGARLEWDGGGEASLAVERTTEAARAAHERYTATITGTSFQGYYRRYGNVVVHYRADPGPHEAGIRRCVTGRR